MAEEPTPFFVLGADRSGTTLLRSLLFERYSIAIPPESEFIRDLSAWRHGPPPQEHEVRALLAAIERHPRYRSWQLEGPLELADHAPFTSRLDAFRLAVAAPFESYARHHESRAWGDKTPSFMNDLGLLDELWPASRFAFIERDGRDVFCSVRSLPFGPNTALSAARVWIDAVAAREAAQAAYGDRVFVVRYEALVRDPWAVVREVAAHASLGLRAAETSAGSDRAVDPRRVAWFPKLRASVDGSSVGRWRNDLAARDLADYQSVAGARLQQLGYEPESTGPARGRLGRRLQSMRELWLKTVHFVTLRLVRERGREVGYVLRRKRRQLR